MRPALVALALLAACTGADDELKPEPGEALSGGDTTLQKLSRNDALSFDALSQPAPNLTLEQRARFATGNAFFTTAWIPAPASTEARDGLGPLFNAAACQSCHIKDGRGRPPRSGEPLVSMIVRLAPADPVYGAQLQDFSIDPVRPEARLRVEWRTQTLRLADGEAVELRQPELVITTEGPPLDAAVRTSLRLAPPTSGLGLLEMIPVAALQALADPDDLDGNGISGRLRMVPDLATGTEAPGRFGWKAAQPTVRQQAAMALTQDMGLTTALTPHDDCTERQRECRGAPDGGQPEVSAVILELLEFYARHLAVPARRWVDTPEVLRGKRVFHMVGCAACHTPLHVTGRDPDQPQLSNQTIRPYTDLLLHDMGPGLADGVEEFGALGSEWRTPPLWGLHLAAHVAGGGAYLHDGRARTLLEAILWHGGEAEAARERVRALPRSEREALIWFLKSL